MRITKSLIQKLSLFTLLLALGFSVSASRPKKGNGKVKTKTYALAEYHSIEIETFCNVNVSCGKMPMAKLTLDENLFQYLDVRVDNGVLKVETQEWLQSTEIKLELQVPFITAFSTSGWGKVNINGLETRSFRLEGETGNVNISGEVDRLWVHSGSGSLNLGELKTRIAEVKKDGWGELKLNITDTLFLSGEFGDVIYEGKPVIIKDKGAEEVVALTPTEDKAERSSVQYITLSVRNNTAKRKQFIIKGPRGATFGYGFPMNAYATRAKNIPVGTRIWEQNAVGGRGELLLEVKPEDAGKTVDLF